MTKTVAPLRIEIIDPLLEDGSDGAPDVIGVSVDAVPHRIYGAETLATFRRRVAPWVEAAHAGQQRVAGVSHWIGRRRDQVLFDGKPRRDSRVRQHLFLSYDDVAGVLPAPASVLPAGRGHVVTLSPFESWEKQGVRAAGTLRLPWSWPGVPVWLTVEPWWRDQTLATIELRTRRRWRYPRRYFRATHSAAQNLRDQTIERTRDRELRE